MLRSLLYVGLGGAIGAGLRFVISVFVPGLIDSAFPWNTFLINLSGCFLIGAFYSQFQKSPDEELYLFVITGILGGFTTFSSFGLETFQMIKAGQVFYAMTYAFGSLTIGTLLVFLAYNIFR